MKLAGQALERFIEGNIFFPETEFIQEPSAVGLAYFEKLSTFISALP